MSETKSIIKDRAAFAIAGIIESPTVTNTSAKGTSYLRLKVKVHTEQGRSWNHELVAFGEVAEEIAEKARQGDRIDLRGSIGKSKNPKSGYWEVSLVIERVETVEHVTTDDEALGGGADFDSGIPF